MEMLVAVAQHRNYDGRNRSQITDGFISSPSRGFKGVNCRTFQSDTGILPFPSHEIVSPASNLAMKERPRPLYSEMPKQQHIGPRRSSPISISPRPTIRFGSFSDELSDSERWAGPAYSNSPPPSSLPIPKFQVCQKRSVSVELSVLDSGNEVHTLAKTAPSPPDRKSCSPAHDFFFNTKSATLDLRRILHLDVVDD